MTLIWTRLKRLNSAVFFAFICQSLFVSDGDLFAGLARDLLQNAVPAHWAMLLGGLLTLVPNGWKYNLLSQLNYVLAIGLFGRHRGLRIGRDLLVARLGQHLREVAQILGHCDSFQKVFPLDVVSACRNT